MLADSQRLVMEVPPAHTAQYDPISRSRSTEPTPCNLMRIIAAVMSVAPCAHGE
jgi:hypothetical protein